MAHLTISAPGFTTAVDSVAVVPPAIQITPGSLVGTHTAIDVPDAFYARVGVATTPSVLTPQPLRAGAADLTVTFAVDDPAVARLVTATDSLPTDHAVDQAPVRRRHPRPWRPEAWPSIPSCPAS